ncbi:hypothetical protein KTR66_18605 [Roseococcus sp. SDR]|uniref:hypothetical protein n=1 Tax=Roseococcus sp. SDR TaxID=2835532 RepID=UPI001BCBEE47|nr:hypothetical protein [Roseococcus sp. SDR]MBS7792018.1 hypothetical protein [Roseococcus sp. SDR]MBV1847332.1 hypothetical protein [Roseococcus sp. SDR]
MPAPDIITTAQFARRVGLPDSPALIGVRRAEDFAANPRALPAASRTTHTDVAAWAEARWPLVSPEHAPARDADGLLAASLGLSRMDRDDLAQLDAGLALYDACFRWCRDATRQTHNRPTGHPA